MSIKERKQKKYLNRRLKREKKKQKFLESIPKFEEVFTFEHLYDSFFLCRKEVGWKPSIQAFQYNLATEINCLLKELYSEKGFRSHGFIEFNICERGKMRHIRSVDIKERVVQRCFCDYYLNPLLTNNLIYDNGANLKNKGVAFTLNRLQKHLHQYYEKYNTNDGYILLFDFHDYFGSINHGKLYKIVDQLILDDRCKKLYHHLIDMFGSVGLGLGSQVSQISAVAFPNYIDHIISNSWCCEKYARYMDDGYIIIKTKENAEDLKEKLLNEIKKLDIVLNPKKIQICRINKSFIFIKKRFYLNKVGQPVIKLNRNNIYKHKRKVRKLFKLIDEGKLTIKDVENSHKSWYGQVKKKYHNKIAIYKVNLQIRRQINEFNTRNRNIQGNSCGK